MPWVHSPALEKDFLAILSQAWWHVPVIIKLRRLKQEDFDFDPSLGY